MELDAEPGHTGEMTERLTSSQPPRTPLGNQLPPVVQPAAKGWSGTTPTGPP
jgi:hypothetical protein